RLTLIFSSFMLQELSRGYLVLNQVLHFSLFMGLLPCTMSSVILTKEKLLKKSKRYFQILKKLPPPQLLNRTIGEWLSQRKIASMSVQWNMVISTYKIHVKEPAYQTLKYKISLNKIKTSQHVCLYTQFTDGK